MIQFVYWQTYLVPTLKDKQEHNITFLLAVNITLLHITTLSLYFSNFNLFLSVLVTVPKVQAVMVGDTLSLKCELEKSSFSDSATVRWEQPKSSDCKLDIPHYKRDISVPNVPMCASGVWTCTVKYNRRDVTAKTTVYVVGKNAFILNLTWSCFLMNNKY